jgi:hypothetical protein
MAVVKLKWKPEDEQLPVASAAIQAPEVEAPRAGNEATAVVGTARIIVTSSRLQGEVMGVAIVVTANTSEWDIVVDVIVTPRLRGRRRIAADIEANRQVLGIR